MTLFIHKIKQYKSEKLQLVNFSKLLKEYIHYRPYTILLLDFKYF